MKLGEFFIKLGVKGDVKKLDEAIRKMEAAKAQDKMRLQFKEKIVRINKLISKATKQEHVDRLKNIKAQLTENYANDLKLRKMKEQRKELLNQKNGWGNLVKGAMKYSAVIAGAIGLMDRLGNSVLKANQNYMNFSRQTGISIRDLNKMIGLARLSGMNLPAEQVIGDITNLQQKIFRLSRFGEGSGIFAQLGMNPIGLDADKFIDSLRQRFKSIADPAAKTYVLDSLGLSREWLNVLELSDKEYQDIVVQSRKLQLSEKERKELAKYTLIQQKNNAQWELAKQKAIMAFLPLITQVTEKASGLALKISELLGNDKIVAVARDFAFLLGIAALHSARIAKNLIGAAIGGIGANLGIGKAAATAGTAIGFGSLGGKAVAKAGARAGLGIGAKALAGAGSIATPLGWLLLATTAVDIYNLIKTWWSDEENKTGEESDLPLPEMPQYAQSVSSSMVNNFYNNPAPQQQITDELSAYVNAYLKGAKK